MACAGLQDLVDFLINLCLKVEDIVRFSNETEEISQIDEGDSSS